MNDLGLHVAHLPLRLHGRGCGEHQGDGGENGKEDAHAPDMTGEWGGFKCG